jgi:nitrite reductase (cytochrome c-552)
MPLTFPWGEGLKVEDVEAFWNAAVFPDGSPFYDFAHKETGAHLLKAQHPEFELWSQGIHARSGVSCADCHMPYMREGATKISDHWVRSPLLNISRACQTCHKFPEEELAKRADIIQERNHQLLQRAAEALMGQLDALAQAKSEGATETQLSTALELQRKAQWRLDFVSSENSMGFHAPQEAARILGEAADYARQGQVAALQWRQAAAQAITAPAKADAEASVLPQESEAAP